MITIYSSPSCMKCRVLKNWCDKNKVEYKSVDITEDATASDLLMSKGYSALPIVGIDDKFYNGDIRKLCDDIGRFNLNEFQKTLILGLKQEGISFISKCFEFAHRADRVHKIEDMQHFIDIVNDLYCYKEYSLFASEASSALFIKYCNAMNLVKLNLVLDEKIEHCSYHQVPLNDKCIMDVFSAVKDEDSVLSFIPNGAYFMVDNTKELFDPEGGFEIVTINNIFEA